MEFLVAGTVHQQKPQEKVGELHTVEWREMPGCFLTGGMQDQHQTADKSRAEEAEAAPPHINLNTNIF